MERSIGTGFPFKRKPEFEVIHKNTYTRRRNLTSYYLLSENLLVFYLKAEKFVIKHKVCKYEKPLTSSF